MTITTTTATADRTPFTGVAFDLYRDIHKAIRVELFAATEAIGRLDPQDDYGRADVVARVDGLVAFLVAHAEHEDGPIQPVLERELPDLAERIATEHHAIESRMQELRSLARQAQQAMSNDRRSALHRLYVELAAFTGDYLAHQDFEERIVGPALEAVVGVEGAIGIHTAIVSAIPPQEMAQSLSLMLPAMNVDDRTEMLGGMQATAPTEVFDGVWSLATSVLEPGDVAVLATRLGR